MMTTRADQETARLNDQFVTRITDLGLEIDKWKNENELTGHKLSVSQRELWTFKRSVEASIKEAYTMQVIDLEQANNILRNLNLNEISLEWNVSGHYDATYHLHIEDKGLSMTVIVNVEVPFTVVVEASDEDIATEQVEGMHLSDLELDWDNANMDLDGSDDLDIEDTDELVRALMDTEPYLTAEIVVDEVEQSRP
jgi:hypothetical protein